MDGTVRDDFDDFISRYGRSYVKDSPEYNYRLSVFQESIARHQRLNSLSNNPWDAKYGVTKFSDLTIREFAEQHAGCARSRQHHVNQTSSSSISMEASVIQCNNRSLDWRKYNFVSGVRNQERCGSCWAFSVVETVESAYAMKSGKRAEPLSPQQLISCDQFANGCEGGDTAEAMGWLERDGVVVVPEQVYPFNSGSGDKTPCRTDLPNEGVRLLNYSAGNLAKNEQEVIDILCTYGPLSVAVDAVSWQDYVGGVIQHHCPPGDLDHAVQIVGFNFEGPVPYYIVRNTWGTDWGLDGYLYIKFGSNMCGIASLVAWVYDTCSVPEDC